MSDKKYTDQQLLFLGYLGAEAKGDIEEAMKLAGYAPASKGWLLKHLKTEIVEIAQEMLSGASIKAAKSIISLLDDPNRPGATILRQTANDILDKAGVKSKEDVGMKVPQGGLIILPAKSGMKIVNDSDIEENKDES